MVRSILIFLLFFLFLHSSLQAQNKAVVLQNVWNNDLNDYSPNDFFTKLFDVLKAKLAVKDLVADPKTITANRKDENWDQYIRQQVNARRTSGNFYFIALASELRLPSLNLGKLFFKNPPRSSKLTFTLHVYDSSGTEVMGDTIINRGCVVKTVDEDKGSKYFYSDYNNFQADMLCHLKYITQILQEKTFGRKQKQYMETK